LLNIYFLLYFYAAVQLMSHPAATIVPHGWLILVFEDLINM